MYWKQILANKILLRFLNVVWQFYTDTNSSQTMNTINNILIFYSYFDSKYPNNLSYTSVFTQIIINMVANTCNLPVPINY